MLDGSKINTGALMDLSPRGMRCGSLVAARRGIARHVTLPNPICLEQADALRRGDFL